MDTSERKQTITVLDALRGALERPGPETDVVRGAEQLRFYEAKLASFIPEPTNIGEGVNDWQQVSNGLRANQDLPENQNGNGVSLLAPSTLPRVERTQRNRVRLEVEDFLLIRQPIFSRYETSILQSAQHFFGLTGPQGFGKSAFLHYFSAKYCTDPGYLVIYVPWCPNDTHTLKAYLAVAFYRGCRIYGLTGYMELTHVDSLTVMMQKCSDFATLNGKQLLVVIDQMKTQPAQFFNSTINNLRNVTGIRLVLSSSISNQVSSVFGNYYQTLERYSYKITPEEATILSDRLGEESSADDLTGLPFQVAAEKIRGALVSLPQLAAGFAEDLLSRPGDASSHQSYFYLQMVADSTIKNREQECMFGLCLDSDRFYVEGVPGVGPFSIEEHRPGLAAAIIAQMKNRQGDYERYLLGMLDNPNFTLLDAGARGRILEDCFAIIFRAGGVQLPFLKIPQGGKPNPPSLSIDAATMRVIEVPGGDEEVPESVCWDPNIDTLVFIPLNRQYKGVDFVIVGKTTKMVYVYFIQCTIQRPQAHAICESELYGQWVALLKSSTQLPIHSLLVYLTPHGANLSLPGPQSIAAFFSRKGKLHVQFAHVKGGHALLDKIKSRYPRQCM